MEVRPQEQRLIDLAGQLAGDRVLCNTAGRAQFALSLASSRPAASVVCWLLDLYQLQQAQLHAGEIPANLALVCEPDPPADEVDLVALCLGWRGDAELARDLLQTGHQRLAIGGRMAVAIDNPEDQWLHEQLRGMFDKVTRQSHADAVVYLASKTKPLRKLKDYACEVAFRDGERLVHLRTRPGVFSHREVDGGARALIKAMQIAPGMQVLDLGCGSGAVGLAAALRAEGVHVQATDTNPRAIEATRWAAERNGAGMLQAALDSDGSSLARSTLDLVLANPPYFSNFRLAGLFIHIAHKALRPGGKLLVVTKTPDWYHEALAKRFESIESTLVGKYVVVSSKRV